MKLYIKAFSTYRGDLSEFDVKKELKQKYKLDTRRQDTFIHLAVYGAQKLKEKIDINIDDELYVTSGLGNIDIIQKTNQYVIEDKGFLKPIDFINMLGNTTSYYVAASLGIKGKNTFEISDNFTFINTLISLYASINISKTDGILCSIDLVTSPDEVIKRVLGVEQTLNLTSSVNYQKLSLNKENALGYVEFDTKIYSLQEIKEIISSQDLKVISSMRCKNLKTKKDDEFFETMLSYYLNEAIRKQEDLVYIDCYEGQYKLIRVMNLL